MEGQSSGRKGKSVVSEDLENEIDEAESENSESGFMESDNEIGDVDDEFRCLKQPVTSSTQQPPMKKLPIKRKLPPTELPPPTIVRWMPTPRICSETGHVTISMDQGTISSSPATQEPPTK
ncbi:hypothetical protein V6N11_043238 [Hibiscus sabdariffa]|uniref:Uncharacterized protein n=1 Tax=Hibiscus sabdariffa TaxID=183260 RepID=A0ABR2QYJ1_9ROSI